MGKSDEDRARRVSVLWTRSGHSRGREPDRTAFVPRPQSVAHPRRHLCRDIRIDGTASRENVGINTEQAVLQIRRVRDDSPAHDLRRPGDAHEFRDQQAARERLGHADGEAPRPQCLDDLASVIAWLGHAAVFWVRPMRHA